MNEELYGCEEYWKYLDEDYICSIVGWSYNLWVMKSVCNCNVFVYVYSS